MDPLVLMILLVGLMGVAIVVLGLVIVRVLRAQARRPKKQSARRALERERRELIRLRKKQAAAQAGVDPDSVSTDDDSTEGEDSASDVSESLDGAFEALGGAFESDDDALEEMRLLLADELHDIRERELALDRREVRLQEWEAQIRGDRQSVDQRVGMLQQASEDLRLREAGLVQAELAQREELARIAGLSQAEAEARVLARAEHEARLHATQVARDIENDARRNAEDKARHVIVQAIQRMAALETTESVVSTVPLPSDDMKGRIIGREGRNIRAFEQITGVNVMIDDTPETVLLSCFDPVRREVAKLTLTELVQDGRIHPARIEEVYARMQGKINDLCIRAAENALADVGITDLAPGLIPILGALRYRTSYGQNVLAHLVESAHIAGLMAAELGLDVAICRRAAFLHDIGKALSHEVEGTHAMVGADLARRFGEHPDIVHAIEAHHNEVEPRTVEAVLTQAADAISGGRPGARRESLELYVQRLQRLEEIAKAQPGVERVFAMQAGREIRVMVAPEQVGDLEAHAIARDVVRQIESELTYPGTIKVTVVRESRAVEVAH